MTDFNSYRPTLTIQVLWLVDPTPDPADKSKTIPDPLDHLAKSLYSFFNLAIDNPMDRRMGIPVFFHSAHPPQPSVLEQSYHTILSSWWMTAWS